MSSDKYNFSGDFRGAVLNVNSRLTNVQQSVTAMQTNDQAARQELEMLIGQLQDVLQKAPPEKKDEAETVVEFIEELVQKAKKENPKKSSLEISGEGLKKAAQNLAGVMPEVVTIASQIVGAVMRLAAPM